MVKMRGTRKGREVLVFGLSTGNLINLQDGKPIHILKEEMPGLPFDIIMFWGPTETALAEMVRPLINKDTIVHEHMEEKKQ
jgi:hypothetical protein